MSDTARDTAPGAYVDAGSPVEVVMPSALLPRLAEPLAAIGLRLYRIPTKDRPTLMIAADVSELCDQTAAFSTAADVREAWSLAVGLLTEPKTANRPRTRKRKVARDAA